MYFRLRQFAVMQTGAGRQPRVIVKCPWAINMPALRMREYRYGPEFEGYLQVAKMWVKLPHRLRSLLV